MKKEGLIIGVLTILVILVIIIILVSRNPAVVNLNINQDNKSVNKSLNNSNIVININQNNQTGNFKICLSKSFWGCKQTSGQVFVNAETTDVTTEPMYRPTVCGCILQCSYDEYLNSWPANFTNPYPTWPDGSLKGNFYCASNHTAIPSNSNHIGCSNDSQCPAGQTCWQHCNEADHCAAPKEIANASACLPNQ